MQPLDMAGNGHDYDAARILHAKGLTIKQIADETGIPYAPLMKFAQRHQWTLARTKVVQRVSTNVQDKLVERSTGHLLKISGFADKAIDNLLLRPLDGMKLGDLQTLASVADTFDKIARRTYGLDKQEERTSVHIGLLMHDAPPAWQSKAASGIVDVESTVLPATTEEPTPARAPALIGSAPTA